MDRYASLPSASSDDSSRPSYADSPGVRRPLRRATSSPAAAEMNSVPPPTLNTFASRLSIVFYKEHRRDLSMTALSILSIVNKLQIIAS